MATRASKASSKQIAEQNTEAAQSPTAVTLSFVPPNSINPIAFFFGILGIITFTKLSSFLTPYKLYFSFSSFLFSHRDLFKWESLAIKLLIPVIVGFLLYYIPFYFMLWTRGSNISFNTIYRYLYRQSMATAMMSSFFAALLLAWPYIVYWDILIQPELIEYFFPFVCIYILYFISYAYFSGLGVNLAAIMISRNIPVPGARKLKKEIVWLDAVRQSMMGIITSAIATYFATALGPTS